MSLSLLNHIIVYRLFLRKDIKCIPNHLFSHTFVNNQKKIQLQRQNYKKKISDFC